MIRLSASVAIILTTCLAAQTNEPSVIGRWLLTADVYGTRRLFTLQLDGTDEHLSANVNGVPVSGALQTGHLHLEGSNDGGEKAILDAVFVPGHLTGKVSQDSKEEAATEFTFTAEPVLPLRHSAQHYEFKPDVFYRQFSPSYAPVLRSIRAIAFTRLRLMPEAWTRIIFGVPPAATRRLVLSSSTAPCPATLWSSTSTGSA